MRVDVHTHSLAERWSKPVPSAHGDAGSSTLLLAFCSPRHCQDEQFFSDLRAAYPRAHLLGCSTAGEILNDHVYDDTAVVAAITFSQTRLRAASARVASVVDTRRAGESLAAELAAPDLKAVFVLSDGKMVNGSDLVAALNDNVGPGVLVSGGLAGDGYRFGKTWVLTSDGVDTGIIGAVGLYGDALIARHGSRGGWDPFGPERTLTRSKGNVLYEIDHRPALELYKRYLGDRVNGLPATALLFPLVIREPGSERRLVRTILGIDEAEQSMIFAGDVPQGYSGQLMRANFDRLVQGASDAAEQAARGTPGGTLVSIAISCVGRRLVLKQRADEELQAALDVLPAGTQQVGFYSYGEISPLASGRCELHNQTMTVTHLSERAS